MVLVALEYIYMHKQVLIVPMVVVVGTLRSCIILYSHV